MIKEPIGPELENPAAKKDRFEKISNNFSELFAEVFVEQGLDYRKLQESVFENVSRLAENFREMPILDVGVGDGSTSKAFVEAGCRKVVGIDLNPDMLESARAKLGSGIGLVQMDATKMGFAAGEFPIIITGTAIHNIPKKDRVGFWQEILRLSPEIFVTVDKIADPDPEKHAAYYASEVGAIRKVYGEKHGLHEAEKTWLDHYECDERERLELEEIEENLGRDYDVEVVFEMGVNKTVVAKKKKAGSINPARLASESVVE